MNYLDGYVVDILSEPIEKYGKWFVKIKYNCWGTTGEMDEIFNTKEQALKLKSGSHLLIMC